MNVHPNWDLTFSEWVQLLDGIREAREREMQDRVLEHFPNASPYQHEVIKHLCLEHNIGPHLLKSTLHTLKGVV